MRKLWFFVVFCLVALVAAVPFFIGELIKREITATANKLEHHVTNISVNNNYWYSDLSFEYKDKQYNYDILHIQPNKFQYLFKIDVLINDLSLVLVKKFWTTKTEVFLPSLTIGDNFKADNISFMLDGNTFDAKVGAVNFNDDEIDVNLSDLSFYGNTELKVLRTNVNVASELANATFLKDGLTLSLDDLLINSSVVLQDNSISLTMEFDESAQKNDILLSSIGDLSTVFEMQLKNISPSVLFEHLKSLNFNAMVAHLKNNEKDVQLMLINNTYINRFSQTLFNSFSKIEITDLSDAILFTSMKDLYRNTYGNMQISFDKELFNTIESEYGIEFLENLFKPLSRPFYVMMFGNEPDEQEINHINFYQFFDFEHNKYTADVNFGELAAASAAKTLVRQHEQ